MTSINQTVIQTFLPLYPFEKFLALQQQLQRLRFEEKIPQVLLLATHPPCFSLGSEEIRTQNPGKYFKLPLEKTGDMIHCNGLPVFSPRPGRGRAVTYHGPGILGCYTIFGHLPYETDDYFELYKNMVLEICHDYEIYPEKIDNTPDLWIGRKKIASVGVHFRTKANLVYFGFNLNVGGCLTPFDYIYPCGIKDKTLGITSLENEIGLPLDIKWVANRLSLALKKRLAEFSLYNLDPCSLFSEIQLGQN